MPIPRRLLPALLLPGSATGQERPRPVPAEAPEGQALVARLRQGGLVLFFRHADTRGETCDRSYRLGDRAGQRNLAPEGRAQAVRLGARLAELGIPVTGPVLAGPVFRARDTAELAFGKARVEVTDGLLADDYAGARLAWVIAEHRRLLALPVPPGGNRVLVGHRTPAIMVFGEAVAGRAFPEGAALVVAPRGAPLDIAPRGAPLDIAPRGAPLDIAPRGAPLDSAPRGAPLDSVPRGVPLDSAPRGAPLDSVPRGVPLDSAPRGAPGGDGFALLGILLLAPLPDGGFHACQ